MQRQKKMYELTGKGMYLWIINENEDPQDTAKACRDAGLSHVAIKIADAGYAYNIEFNTNGGRPWGRDKVPPLVSALRAAGVSPWGWVFVYGSTPDADAEIAIERTKTLGIDGLIVNAEGAYKGKHAAAKRYMAQVRNALGGKIPLALSSYRFPDVHPDFPWVEFLSQVDINMPQVYWMLAHNAGDQMQRCYEQFQKAKFPQVPIFPTGAAFSEHSWRPTVAEIRDFMNRAKSLGLKGCNFWVYEHARHRFPEYWGAISEYEWPAEQGPVTPPSQPEPLPDDALNKLYYPCDPKWPVTQRFGVNPGTYTISKGHNGVDWGIPVGNPIYCAWKGVVEVAVEQTNGYGRHVRVRHPFGVTIYGHLSRIDVKVGDVVEAKQVLGLSGGATSDPYSGMSTGPHLHFEIRQNEPVVPLVPGSYVYNAIDPMPYLVAHELPDAPVGVDYYLISLSGSLSLRSAPDASVSNVIGYVYATDPPYQSFERAKDALNRDWYKVTREGKVGWIAGYTQWTTITKVYAPKPDPDPEPEPPSLTLEERVDRVEGDLNLVMDWIRKQDMEAFDA